MQVMPSCQQRCLSLEALPCEKRGEGLSAGKAMRARKALCTALIVVASAGAAGAFDELATSRVVAAPRVPEPRYLVQVSDSVFGTAFTRVTEPGRLMASGVSCRPEYCTHRYSSSQAWNADQTLLVIANGCAAGFCFLDGQTYQPLFHRRVPNECEWHPTDAATMICVSPQAIYLWTPRSNEAETIFAPTDYTNLQFGPWKGNPSHDGSRLVVRAKDSAGKLVAFAYNIPVRKKYPDIDLSGLPGENGYCGISPSGRYVVCFQTLVDGTETAFVFCLDGTLVQHWTDHHRPGHGDMTIDADGSDVYVGISKAAPDKYHVIKRRLEDGVVTDLAPYGEATHASLRNIDRPGWVFLSYSGTYEEIVRRPQWAPFYQEVVALRIDGSGEVRRIVQTHNPKADYWSETHATPSRDGSRVIWSSNWDRVGGPVSDYLARLSWPATPAREQSSR
jgi:hypothetical protein